MTAAPLSGPPKGIPPVDLKAGLHGANRIWTKFKTNPLEEQSQYEPLIASVVSMQPLLFTYLTA